MKMRKNNLKRILALLMAGTMVLGLASCGDTDKDNDTSSGDNQSDSQKENTNMDGDVELNKPGEFPIVKEGQDPVHLSIFVAPQLDTCTEFGRDVNPVTKHLEDKFNLRFDWETVSKADKQAKQNLLFTVDDYPDIIFNSGWDGAALTSYADAGYLIPFDDYLETDSFYWDKYKKYGLKSGHPAHTQEALDTTVMPDGKTYGFYTYSVALHGFYTERMWVYEPWLDAVGMDMPKTTDEFYDVLKAFKTKDPNGNGKADEIPLAGVLKGYNADPRDFLLNAFTMYTGEDKNYIYNKDGKIQFNATEDAYRDGLEYLHKLSSEGLLLSETWTQDPNSLKALTTQEDQLVGFVPGGSPTAFTTAVSGQPGDWTNFKSVAPLKGPDGFQSAPYSAGVPVCRFNITDNCEYPRIAVRFGDAIYDNEVGNDIRWGLKDDFWEFAEEGMVGLDGKPATVCRFNNKDLAEDLPKKNFCWSQVTNNAVFPTWHTSAAVITDPEMNLESILYNSAVEYSKYTPKAESAILTLIFSGDTAKQVIDWRTSIYEYIETSSIEFITQGITDKSWDAFKKELDNRGLQDLLKVTQDAFDAQH